MAHTLLKGTAFITGAASGIGKGIALSFARSGITKLSLNDINSSLLSTTASEIKSQFPNVEVLTAGVNVCEERDVDEAVRKTVEKWGRIDVAVNVAGIGGAPKRTSDLEEEEWRSVINVNLDGVWRCQRAELKAMLAQEDLGPRIGRGNIINLASMYGLVGTPTHIQATSYTASKHAVIGLTKADANQYAMHGIRINALCPGYISTPLLLSAVKGGAMDGEIAKTPMRRLGSVEEIGDACVFLGGKGASFMTGGVLLVDGGYCAN